MSASIGLSHLDISSFSTANNFIDDICHCVLSTSLNLPDKDQIRVHVRRDGLIERQRFNARVWRQLCKYDDGEECPVVVAYRSLCVRHYHQTSDITVNESKRRQLIQQSATAATSSKATTTTATMIPSKNLCY
ncbi:unnamed protein product [Rotaria sp. Silwood2]|nr:unnamed protein product [Rotaria sp. Silwood2]